MANARKLTPEEEALVKKEMEVHAKEFVKQVTRLVQLYEGRIGSTTILYDGYAQRRKDQPKTMMVIETFASAVFPKPSQKTNAQTAIKTLKGFVKGRQWDKFQAGIKNVEKIANLYADSVQSYRSKVDSTNSKIIKGLEFTRDNGFIAVGSLCTTFVGGPIAVAAGLANTYRGAALGAAVGGMLSAEIKAVASSVGRAGSGQDLETNLLQLKYDALSKGAQSAIISAIFAPLAKVVNDKMLKGLSEEAVKNGGKRLKNITGLKARGGVGVLKTYLVKWIKGPGKATMESNIATVLKGSSKDFDPTDVQIKAVKMLANDKKFLEGLDKALEGVK